MDEKHQVQISTDQVKSRLSSRLNMGRFLHIGVLTRDRALLAICALGFVLGCYGIWWGWVEPWNPDQMALLPLREYLEPSMQMKPPFHTYLNFFVVFLPFSVLGKLITFFGGTKVGFHLAILYSSRILQLLLFVGVIYLSYRIVCRAAGEQAGRLVALFIATSAGFVLQAHFLTTDIPVTFWMLLSFYFAQSIIESSCMRNYVVAGLLMGIATATKYNGLAVGLAIPLFHWLANTDRPFLRIAFDRRLVIGVACVVVGFILANPYAMLNWEEFAADFYYNYVTTPVYDGQSLDQNSYAAFPMKIIEIIGLPLSVVSFIGLIGTLVYTRRWDRLQQATLIAALGVFLLYFWKFGGMPRLEVRFVLPVLPYLLIAAAPSLLLFFSLHRGIASAVVFTVVAYNTLASIWVGHRFAHDPRMVAQAWVVSHVAKGSTIESSYYSPHWNKLSDIRLADVRMPMVSGRVRLFNSTFNGDASVLQRAKAMDATGPTEPLSWFSLQELMKRRPDYIAVDSVYYDRFLKPGSKVGALYPSMRRYFIDLLRERYPYKIVFDKSSPPPLTWLYPSRIEFVDNRITILQRR